MSDFSRRNFIKGAALGTMGLAASGLISGAMAESSEFQGGSKMKIASVEPILCGRRYLFVKITAENGEYGWGECGAWAWHEATKSVVETMGKSIIGKDPFKIEWINNALSRTPHFRGMLVQAAISGIDIALWDLKARHFGVPIYQLLGGNVRDKIRCYVTVSGKTAQEIADGVKAKVDEGWDMVRIRVLHETDEVGATDNTAHLIRKNIEVLEAIRETAGWDVDISVEWHRGLKPSEAIEYGKRADKYLIHFYEDPVCDINQLQAMVQENCLIPIATGERGMNIYEHFDLITKTNVRFLRPDMCIIGGISAGKRVASMAEPKGIYLIPHNPLGPISTAAAFQIDAHVPNFECQEWPGSGINDFITKDSDPFVITGGYFPVSDKPGLGIDIPDNIAELQPFTGAHQSFSLHADGSIVDR